MKQFWKKAKRLIDFQYLTYTIKYFYGRVIIKKYLSVLYNSHSNVDIQTYNFEIIQRKKMLSVINFASRKSEYYKNVFKQNNIDISNFDINNDWNKIPCIDRDIINQNSSSLYTMKIKDYVGRVTTGGSTGNPLGFYRFGGYDSEHQLFLFQIMGFKKNIDKILWMGGTELPKSLTGNNVFWKHHNAFNYKYYSLSSQYMTNDNIDIYIKFFMEYKPTIIRGYPSFIYLFCENLKIKNIKIGFSIKGVELTSEVSYDYQKKLIKEVLDTKIYLQYGHAEGSVFGYSYADSETVYCSPVYGYTEILDKNGKHVNSGEIGEVIVTGFDNLAMQFIRYKTGDLAEYGETNNGITVLNKIYGRTQDFLYDSKMNKILVTAIIYGMHYKAFTNIKQMQLIQRVPGEVIFCIVRHQSYSEEDEIELKTKFMDTAGFKSEFIYKDFIETTNRGKIKFVVQEVNDRGYEN